MFGRCTTPPVTLAARACTHTRRASSRAGESPLPPTYPSAVQVRVGGLVRAVASQQRRSVSLNSLATPSPHPLRSPPDPRLDVVAIDDRRRCLKPNKSGAELCIPTPSCSGARSRSLTNFEKLSCSNPHRGYVAIETGTLSGRFASFFGVRCSRKTLALVQQFIVGSSSFFAKTNFLFKFITGKRR